MKRYNNVAELYDIFYKHRVEDISFYNSLISKYKPVLDNNNIIEIGAGTGRILLPMAKNNPDLIFTAVDMNPDELNILETQAKKLNISNINIIHSKIEDYNTTDKFSFALAPFRVLQH